MPAIDLSILNQRQTPAFYADVFANRPAAGFVGRIFVSTNTFAFYRDNGTGWDLIGGPGTGTITGSGAAGQVSFWNGASTITGENNLWWDSANNHLGINTNTPATALDVNHNGTLIAKFNNTTSANSLIAFENAGNEQWWIGTENTNNDFLFYDATNFPTLSLRTTFKTNGQVLIGTSSIGSGKLVVASTTSDNGIQIASTAAPSLRIDNAVTGPTLRMGLGIATTTNDFIQNSAVGDVCIFSAGTTPRPITFGVYDTGIGFVVQAARISAARNFLVGQTTDSGERLIISGVSRFNGNITANNDFQDFGTSSKQAFLYSDTGSGYLINLAANNISGGGTSPFGRISFTNNISGTYTACGLFGYYTDGANNASQAIFWTKTTGGSITQNFLIRANGNVQVPNGNTLLGTSVDAGYKLAVNGSTIIGNPATNSLYGGFAFFTLFVVPGTTTNFFQVPGSNNWGGITEITWVSSADANRSGAALLRWAYDSGTGNTGLVFTAYNNNQNAVPTFDFSGGYLRISISGGGSNYYVQFRIQGSQSV